MHRPAERKPETRLLLVTEPAAETHRIAPVLAACCEAVDVAAVLLRLAPGSDAELTMRVHALAPAVQTRGAALLLDGRAELAVRTGADGAQLNSHESLKAALPLLKPDRIAGCGSLTTRHDSMVAAETGADYVLFGEPDERNHRPGFDAVRERVAWWAELFSIPCVAYAATLAEAGELARAGADFVALPESIWNSSEGVGALVEAQARVRAREAAT